ncbi:MAG: alpha/beta hydrolase [Pseudohongiellaceae bacterium]
MQSHAIGDSRLRNNGFDESFLNPPVTRPNKPTYGLFRLADGVSLAYQEFGSPRGFPVFYLHSTGGSRLECAFFDQSARKLGFRLIAVDRPGIGYSDFKNLTSLSEFAGNLLELANALKIPRFGLMSFSSGGMFALATAVKVPERVAFQLNLGSVSGNLLQESMLRNKPCRAYLLQTLVPSCVRLITRLRHTLTPTGPLDYIARLQEILCYTDRKILAEPKYMEILETSLAESLRQGIDGVAQDASLCFINPGFALEDVKVPVYIWQGTADTLNSPLSAEYLASKIPGSNYRAVPHGGYFFFVHCMDEIFSRVQFQAENLQYAAA